jgi:5-methylcytosine-specific restriction endonuclease McrA
MVVLARSIRVGPIMKTCPECGDEFDTIRGVRTHYGMSHSGNMDNNECDLCGQSFYSESTLIKTCSECNPHSGENNPNFSGGKDSSKCLCCGDTIHYYPSAKSGKYCSDCQKERPWVDEDSVNRMGEPSHYGNTEIVECHHCGENIEKPVSEVEEKNFCDITCLSEWKSDSYQAEGHPNWTGGYESEYIKGWWSSKQEVLERDKHQCVMCGKSKEEMGREPDVHHIEPLREFDDLQKAHDPNNLVSLCRQCHAGVENGSKDLNV